MILVQSPISNLKAKVAITGGQVFVTNEPTMEGRPNGFPCAKDTASARRREWR